MFANLAMDWGPQLVVIGAIKTINTRLRYTEFLWLVVSTPLKNMKVSWDYYSQYMEK
jgi:hypothetical protein